jgi:hypothetical protein
MQQHPLETMSFSKEIYVSLVATVQRLSSRLSED